MQKWIGVVIAATALLAGPALAKDKVKSGDDLAAWMGMWMAGADMELQISIAPGIENGLSVDAYAIYSDTASTEIGAVTVGSFAGQVPAEWIENGTVRIASSGEAIIPLDEASDHDCVVDMSLVRERILLVTDNGKCGRPNVSFNGTYNRVD